MFKTLSIITAQALMFVSLEAVQNARTQGSDTNSQWLLHNEVDYSFANGFDQSLLPSEGLQSVGILNQEVKKNHHYSIGNNVTATFSQIVGNQDVSSGIYNVSGINAFDIDGKLIFNSIESKSKKAYGINSFASTNSFTFTHDAQLHFDKIIGKTYSVGIHTSGNSQDTFGGEGIISFDSIDGLNAFPILVEGGFLKIKNTRVYYGEYINFDNNGYRSALYANLDNSRNAILKFGLATVGKTALITTNEVVFNSFAETEASSWLIAPSSKEVYGMYFSSTTTQAAQIQLAAYGISMSSPTIQSFSISTQGFGENTSAKQVALIYASGNLELDLINVSFASGVDHTTQGASVTLSSGKSAGVIVGASDSQNSTTINFKEKETTFASIKGKEAYGLVLQNNAKANISNLAFETITGSDKSVGIAFEGNASLSGGITFTNTPSTALQIYSGVKASILGSIVFKNPQTSTSLIDNQGELDLLSSARLTFGEIPSSDIDAQKIETGIRNVYATEIGLNLGNIHIQTQATKVGAEAYGIFSAANTSTRLTLDESKTLTFDIKKQDGNEGIAFGRGKDTQNNKGAIHLTLSQNSNLIFNSNAGELDSLSGSNANISLAGNKSRISSSSLQLRSLSVGDFKLSSSTITLFASQEANISSNGFAEGKAYNQDKTQAQSGGSDRIVISSSTSGQTLNNTLVLTMDTFSKSQTYAILAQVKGNAKNNVVFNNLADGESTTIKAYAGFESADITLKRTDSNGDAYYYIDFSPQNIQVNQDYITPTISAMLSNYTLYLANFNSLNKRMGELRDSDGEQGVWARVFGGELSNEFGAGSTNYYATTQAGYDYGFALSEARDYLGVSLAYIYANNQVNSSRVTLGNSWIEGEVDSKTQGVEFGIYNSYIQDSGLYADSIFKFAYLSSSFELFNQAQDNNIDNLSLIVGQEVGYRYDFASVEGLYLTPSVEVAFGYLSGANFSQTLAMSNQTQYTLNSHQDDIFITRGKIEATLGYFLATDFGMSEESVSKRGASLYLGLGYEYDYVSGGKISYKSTQNTPSTQTDAIGSDGRVVLNLGTNLIINDDARVYFDFESNFLGKINKDYQLNAGVRILLGKVEVKKNAEEGSEAPLKIQ